MTTHHHTGADIMTTTTTTTPILDNVRAVIADHGPFDGKRGSVWTPREGGSAFYTDARLQHRTTVPQSLEIILNGDATRNDTGRHYSPGIRVRVSRYHHLHDGDGSYVAVYVPSELFPDHARDLIANEIAERFAAARYALGYGATEHDAGAFLDAMWHEASRQALAHELDRKRDDLTRLAEQVDQLAQIEQEGGTWTNYGKS